MLVMIVDESEEGFVPRVFDARELPPAQRSPGFEEWLRTAGAGDVYRPWRGYSVVRLGADSSEDSGPRPRARRWLPEIVVFSLGLALGIMLGVAWRYLVP